jgi:hypothetical protein
VQSLAFSLSFDSTSAAYLPLLQLSELTCLKVEDVGAAAAAAVGVAAQLTGLKQLAVSGLPQLTDPTLLQLTALTALEALNLVGPSKGLLGMSARQIVLRSKVRTS